MLHKTELHGLRQAVEISGAIVAGAADRGSAGNALVEAVDRRAIQQLEAAADRPRRDLVEAAGRPAIDRIDAAAEPPGFALVEAAGGRRTPPGLRGGSRDGRPPIRRFGAPPDRPASGLARRPFGGKKFAAKISAVHLGVGVNRIAREKIGRVGV